MAANLSRDNAKAGLRASVSEEGRALMEADEVRRTGSGLLLVRQNRPILFDPVGYPEIHPWRNQVGINPFFNKPYRKKVRLRL